MRRSPSAGAPGPGFGLAIGGAAVKEAEKCVACGFCLPACPTFLLSGEEGHSPRGRLALALALAGGKLPLDGEARSYFDACVGCRACEPVCPAGVRYGWVLEAVRAETRGVRAGRAPRGAGRGTPAPLWRFLDTASGLGIRGVLRLLGRPGTLAASTLLLSILSRGLESLGGFPLPRPDPGFLRPLPAFTPARGRKRGTVAFFPGCVGDLWFRRATLSSIELLSLWGFDVLVPRGQGCCGALALHEGYPELARAQASRNARAFLPFLPRVEAVLVDAAGCSAVLREYPHLLGEAGEKLGAAVRDLTDFLDRVGPPEGLARLEGPSPRVAFQDPCQLLHAQGVREAPRRLLALAGARVVEVERSGVCCGAGGTYFLRNPGWAGRLREDKWHALEGSGAEVVVSENPGCLLWLEGGRPKAAPPLLHISVFLRSRLRLA